MPLFTKPQFNSVWAATGAKLTPESTKISSGWVVEIPPHEYENWVQNRQDALLAHLNQVGIPMWDSSVEYQAGKSYVQGTTSGVVYRALTTHTNINPEIDISNNWAIAFEASGNALLKSQNLADVPDKALARTNLGIVTTEFYDSRYLVKSQNLADVPNKASARGILDVFSRQEVVDLVETFCPAGEIAPFARTTPPAGWLVCDGSTVSRVTYARLFSAIGTTFGAGNGTTTFKLPDLRGEFIRGFDIDRGVDTGRAFGSYQQDAMQPITGTLTNTVFNSPASVSGAFRIDSSGFIMDINSGYQDPQAVVSFDSSRVTRVAQETRPRNIALLYCIRT